MEAGRAGTDGSAEGIDVDVAVDGAVEMGADVTGGAAVTGVAPERSHGLGGEGIIDDVLDVFHDDEGGGRKRGKGA